VFVLGEQVGLEGGEVERLALGPGLLMSVWARRRARRSAVRVIE
jgi:hypothetical protein